MSMSHAFRGSLTDHPAAVDFTQEIGRLVVNAGGIELLVDAIISLLNPAPTDFAALRKDTYANRARRLKQLAADREVAKHLQKRLSNILDKAADCMQKRNTIAHGAVGLLFKGEATDGAAPFAVGILDLKNSKQKMVPYVKLPQLREAVNQAQRAAAALDTIFAEIRGELAAGGTK